MFPTMIEHRCSEGKRGGFLKELIAELGWAMLLNTLPLKSNRLQEWKLDLAELAKQKRLEFTMLFLVM